MPGTRVFKKFQRDFISNFNAFDNHILGSKENTTRSLILSCTSIPGMSWKLKSLKKENATFRRPFSQYQAVFVWGLNRPSFTRPFLTSCPRSRSLAEKKSAVSPLKSGAEKRNYCIL